MAKTIVTHKNPHVDDVAAIWIFLRFIPAWANAKMVFVHADSKQRMRDTRDKIHIGVGHGAFDEHKGNTKDSATTLVWKWGKKNRKYALSTIETRALKELVHYINDEDHGLLFAQQAREFMIGSVFTYLPSVTKQGSRGSLQFGLKYLDAVFSGLKEKHALLADWRKRKEFTTKWGRGVAITTKVSSKVVARVAYAKGFTLFVYRNPVSKYTSIKAQNNSRVNLTRAYNAVKKLEPKSEWYLHHSKKMLICGSDVAANLYLSSAPLSTLISYLR